jgi:hypothetical protein
VTGEPFWPWDEGYDEIPDVTTHLHPFADIHGAITPDTSSGKET